MSKKSFILQYEYTDDMINKRTPFRADHLKLAEQYLADKKIVAAGAFSPPTGGQFIFTVESEQDVETFVKNDPYFTNKLVTEYKIREWTVVVGAIK